MDALVVTDDLDHSSKGGALGLRIFLVEDSPSVRDVIIEQLADIANTTVVGYADTEENAIEQLRCTACDVIVLDIRLKRGSGLGVLRHLQKLGPDRMPATRIILSNYVEGEYRKLAQRYGAQYFFDKAADFSRLLTLLAELAGEQAGSRDAL